VQHGKGRLSMGHGFKTLQSLILVDALVLLDAGRRRKGKKKKERETLCGGGFPEAGPALLSMLWVTAVRCN
jgi:hypothetical protein